MSKYPHMAFADIPVWERYLEQKHFAYTSIAYDVRVGEGRPIPPDTSPELAIDWQALTMKRIDAVAFLPKEIHIIEVKPRASLSAIGQVLGYCALYEKTFSPTIPTKCIIITDEAQPDLFSVTSTHKIKVIEVGPRLTLPLQFQSP